MIRKKTLAETSSRIETGLDLIRLASFEVSSEDADFPLEGALEAGIGWRAAEKGPQTIRLTFDAPQAVARIALSFEEHEIARTQEFAVLWRAEGEEDFRELHRQQFNFSPPQTVSEKEDYQFALRSVVGIELRIIPEISGGGVAALSRLLIW